MMAIHEKGMLLTGKMSVFVAWGGGVHTTGIFPQWGRQAGQAFSDGGSGDFQGGREMPGSFMNGSDENIILKKKLGHN